jgi:O-antigen/teichoic acid export membrane protein
LQITNSPFSGALTALCLRLTSAATGIVLTVIVARNTDLITAGQFFFILALLNPLSVACRLGYDQLIIRIYSVSGSPSDSDSVTLPSALGDTTLASLFTVGVALAVVYVGEKALARDFDVFRHWYWIAPLPLMSLSFLCGFYCQAKHHLFKAQLLQNLLANSACILALVVLIRLHSGLTLSQILTSFSSAWALTVLLWIRSSGIPNPVAAGHLQLLKPRLAMSSPFWISQCINQITLWCGVWIVATYYSASDVAVFSAAQRIALTLSVIAGGIQAFSGPRLISLAEKHGIRPVVVEALRYLVLAYFVSSPVIIFTLTLPSAALTIFGDEFTSGGGILRVLVLGQVLNIATMTANLALIAAKRERLIARITLYCCAITIVSSSVLAGIFGPIGAALGILVANFSQLVWSTRAVALEKKHH